MNNREEWAEWLQHPLTRQLFLVLENHNKNLLGDFRKCGSWEDHRNLDGRISGVEEIIDLIKGLGKNE